MKLSANASPELRYLVAAIRRAGTARYANFQGERYYHRRQVITELRGCLKAWRDSL